MHSVLKYEKLRDFSFLLLSKPLANIKVGSPHSTLIYHTHWQSFFSSILNLENTRNTSAFHLMIWASKVLRCRQIVITHSDITGLTVQLGNRFFLIISVYIPWSSGRIETDQRNLVTRLHYIYQGLEIEKSQNPDTELILTGNFNRWDFYLRGDAIESHFWHGEAAKLIAFMSDLSLVQLLQHDTQTYHLHLGFSSTIDLVFTLERLVRCVLECKLHITQYSSDHKAIESQFDLKMAEVMYAPRLLFKSAPWGKIIEDIKKDLRAEKINAPPLDLNEYTSQLLAFVTNSLQKWVPKVKPCPYSKRCWNVYLTSLWSKFSRLRNQARRFRRLGQHRLSVEKDA